MSEEKYNENDAEVQGEILADNEPIRSKRLPLIIGLSVIGVVIIGAGLYWAFRGGEGGKPVSAPRTVSFGDNTQTSGTAPGVETVTIPSEQVESIGLRVETVGETLSAESMSVAATGVVQPDAYKETPVISLLGGVLRSVSGELGQNVGKGQALAVVFSDELAASQARYLTLQTEAQTARQNYDRTAKLVKISPVSSTDVDQTLARLRTVQAELIENKQRYERTVKLVEIGASSREELEQAKTKLRSAEANVEEAKKRSDRAVEVADINPLSRSDFEQAAVKRQMAESDLATARQRLLLYGMTAAQLNSLRSPSQITSTIALTSPVTGTITKRTGNQGEVVEANKEVMRVTDLSGVWVIAQVYEKDLGQMRNGSGASVTSDAFPGRVFRGHVTYIDPNIDQATRTAQVRVELDNPGRILKIGMYVNIAFGSTGNAERTMPAIPVSAVQNMNARRIVFVATDKPNVFAIKTVRLGEEANGKYTVLEGLNVGDRVVTEGSFLLRAELLKQDPSYQ